MELSPRLKFLFRGFARARAIEAPCMRSAKQAKLLRQVTNPLAPLSTKRAKASCSTAADGALSGRAAAGGRAGGRAAGRLLGGSGFELFAFDFSMASLHTCRDPNVMKQHPHLVTHVRLSHHARVKVSKEGRAGVIGWSGVRAGHHSAVATMQGGSSPRADKTTEFPSISMSHILSTHARMMRA